LDRLVGGVGLRRGRRDPQHLRVGEALDFWRVDELEPGRLLRLRAEMRLPGRARLEMRAEPTGDGGCFGHRSDRGSIHATRVAARRRATEFRMVRMAPLDQSNEWFLDSLKRTGFSLLVSREPDCRW
jgi:Protein of unknown function (DUF2867)